MCNMSPLLCIILYFRLIYLLLCFDNRFKLMNMTADRRAQSNRWETHICPEIHKKIEAIIEESRSLRVGRSSEDTYEVIDNHSTAVSLRDRKCSCRKWEVHGLPCKHACAAIMQTNTSVHSYVDDYFTVEAYRRSYAESIYPIPDSDKPCDDNRDLQIRPPITKKRPDRPRRRRIESQGVEVRDLHCSRCHEAGHNRRSCNAVVQD